MKRLSIIYPVQSLHTDVFVEKAIKSYNANCKKPEFLQHIVISSEPEDKSFELAEVRIVKTQSRGSRLNAGIPLAESSLLLFHHPRSVLDPEGIDFLVDNSEELQWGAFHHQFDKDHWGLRFTSWYSNNIRGRVNGIYYLDHCLFAQKPLVLKAGSFPEVDIFEDTVFCQRMNRVGFPQKLPFCSVTSAVRFSNNGFWKQSLLNQKLKWNFYFRKDHEEMNQEYEKELNLNSKYEE